MLRLMCVLCSFWMSGVVVAEVSALADKPPQRLISVDAGVTEILTELNLADRLVAVDASSDAPGLNQLPRLGYHRALSAEGLIALSPDLVVGSEQMGPPHALDAVRRAGINILTLPYPGDIDALKANIATVASATGSAQGAELTHMIDRKSARLRERALDGYRAALLLRGEGGKLRLAGTGTGGAGFVALLGATNIAEYEGYRSITPEGLLEMAPDLLLLVDTEGQGVDDILQRYPVLRFSPAVRAGQVHGVSADALVAGVSLAAVDEAIRVAETAQMPVAVRER